MTLGILASVAVLIWAAIAFNAGYMLGYWDALRSKRP